MRRVEHRIKWAGISWPKAGWLEWGKGNGALYWDLHVQKPGDDKYMMLSE